MVKCVRCGTDLGPAETACPICGTPRAGVEAERPVAEVKMVGKPGEYVLVDGLTLKDYYDIRDMRLLLWGLEKELGERYGITAATDLGAKVRGLIEEKIKKIEAKLGSAPPSIGPHSSPTHPPKIALLEKIYKIWEEVYTPPDLSEFSETDKSLIRELESGGYLKVKKGKIYLTESGLLYLHKETYPKMFDPGNPGLEVAKKTVSFRSLKDLAEVGVY